MTKPIRYKATRLKFERDVIDQLKPNEIFEIDVRDEGVYRLTKRDFMLVFGHITKTRSWENPRHYHYPTTPKKALQFLV